MNISEKDSIHNKRCHDDSDHDNQIDNTSDHDTCMYSNGSSRRKRFRMIAKKDNQEKELEEVKKRLDNLESIHLELLAKKNNVGKNAIETISTNTPQQKQMDMWCEATRNHFASIKKILMLRDPNIEKDPQKFEREKIFIKLPHRFILQKFFDTSCNEHVPNKSTFLFRDLDHKSRRFSPKNYFSYKLFLDWDVAFDGPIKSKKGHRIKVGNELDRIGGREEGSQFISMFCMQLCDLSVMLPFDSDIKNTRTGYPRETLQDVDFIRPEKGSKVLYEGRYATIINHSSGYRNTNLEIDADGEQVFGVERKAFVIEQIPIKLFQQTSGGIVPERDNIFETALMKYKSLKFDPKLNISELQERAKQYYRAVGRFLLHVMADGSNPIPTTVMPEFYRNVLLRGCMPGSEEYNEADLYRHLAQIGEFKDIRRFFGCEFDLFDIEKEGIITKENFKTDFAPAYMVDARRKNLEALREGLTLNGEFPIDFLKCQPLEAINQTFFSKPSFSVQDIIVLLKPCYENEILDEVSRDNHELFMKQTLPQALEALEKIEKESKKDSSFLADFLFFATGLRWIPYSNGMPDFNLSILFAHIPDDSLPATHTCENLLHIPWGVYDNNVVILMEKLQKAVKYALVAGYDRM